MSKKLKGPGGEKVNILTKGKSPSCPNSERLVLFSFASITKSDKYSFGHFGKDMRREVSARRELEKFLEFLSSQTWLELSGKGLKQKGGFESILMEQVQESICRDPRITPDTQILSFRFGPADSFRLLGYKPTSCQRLNILGYDFDFSAYDHGK